MDRNRGAQFARSEDFDQRLLARCQSKLFVVVKRDLGDVETGDAVQVDDRVLGPKDIGESALGQAPVERHLAAFKAAHYVRAGTRTLALVAAGRSLAHAGTHTAADTLALRICLAGRA